jgi:hypothetical protein
MACRSEARLSIADPAVAHPPRVRCATVSLPEEDWPAALALWLAEITGGPVPRFEKVERKEPVDGVVIEGDDL